MGDLQPPPLAGLTIIEVATHIAGPYCAGLLGGMGAEVIKVEPRGGDPLRRYRSLFADGRRPRPFWGINRNKRSVVLDFRVTALLVRDETGWGQHVQTSLLQSHQLQHLSHLIFSLQEKVETVQAVGGIAGPFTYQLFPTQDDYIFIGYGTGRFWQRFCTVIERPELATDSRYHTNLKRCDHREALVALFIEVLQGKTTAEWVKLFENAGVPCASVRPLAAMFMDPQVAHNRAVAYLQHPVCGQFECAGVPVRLQTTPGSVRLAPPLLGEHTDEIVVALRRSGAPTVGGRRGVGSLQRGIQRPVRLATVGH